MSSVKLEIHLPIEMKDSQAVLFKEKLYVGGGTTETQTDSAMLYIYSPDSRAWDSMNTPVSHFALAVYQSQIVLVGGKECCCENISQITNKVWVMTEQINHWKTDIIPHMKLHRSGAVAVSIDSVLIVTGGEHELSALYIEIYDGNDMWWNIKRPSDLGVSDVKMAFHEGNCYLMGGLHGRSVFSANLGTLVSSSKAGGDHEEDLSLWRQIPDIPEQVAWGCPAIFGSRLVVQNGGILYAFCPSTQVWVLVPLKMKMPNENIYSACVIGSNRELIVIGGVSAETKLVSKEIIQVSINCK